MWFLTGKPFGVYGSGVGIGDYACFIHPVNRFGCSKVVAAYHPAYTLREYWTWVLLKFSAQRARMEAETRELVLPARQFDLDLTTDEMCRRLDNWPSGLPCSMNAVVPCAHSEMTIDGLGVATCDLCKSELWFDRRTSNWAAKNSPIVPGIKIRLGWLQRLARRMFPARHLEPQTIPDMKDCLTSVVRSDFSFADRLRILFSGRLETTVRVSVTVPIGRTATVADSCPRPPKWMRLD